MATVEAVDTTFIRRAVELADVNALRVALYQMTNDPAVAALPPAAQMSADEKGALIDRVVAWLTDNASRQMPDEPPLERLRELMTLATGRAMSDDEFEARRDLPAFRTYPFAVEWTGDHPPVSAGFTVAIIGSGFSGIAAAVQCEILGIPYTVYDRQPEAGGTWSINRYPEIRVDTPSITYEFSFEKRYPWDEHFGRGEAVRGYLNHVSRKYGARANTRFGHDLKTARFDEAGNRWMLTFTTAEGEHTAAATIVISASGTFANAIVPDFPGKANFRGQIVHPSQWPEGLDLTGKRVAVIGNGSTGVQMLRAVARDAAAVHVFQRTAQWISPRENYGMPMEPELSWLVDNMPGYWNWWRYMATAALFDIHALQVPDAHWQANGGKVNPGNDALRDTLTQYIHAQTGGRADLIDKLVPDYAPFSRRPVVDNGWYRALTQDNVELVCDPIARLVPEGIETEDGVVREVDVIISATGFAVSKYLWPARYSGIDGRDLHDSWDEGDGPRAYLGLMVPGFPNLFMLYGPNSQPLSGGTGLPQWYMVWASYAGQCMMRMIERGATRVDVTSEACDRYNRALDEEASDLLQLTPEGGVDRNYYVNAQHGRLQVNAPWQSHDFHHMCTQVTWDDLVFSGSRDR